MGRLIKINKDLNVGSLIKHVKIDRLIIIKKKKKKSKRGGVADWKKKHEKVNKKTMKT